MVLVPAGSGIFFPSTSSGALSVSFPMNRMCSFLRAKRLGAEEFLRLHLHFLSYLYGVLLKQKDNFTYKKQGHRVYTGILTGSR
jgi:hypothetical protein